MDWEGTTDMYARVFFDSRHAKETDTHFRCQTGKGSFNYRLLFDLNDKDKNKNLSIQLWDRDLLSANEIIGDAAINLAMPVEDAARTGKPIVFSK